MQCSSEGCSLAQWKDIQPWRPEGKFGGGGKKMQRSFDGRGRRMEKNKKTKNSTVPTRRIRRDKRRRIRRDE
jgi:hypothetical protein